MTSRMTRSNRFSRAFVKPEAPSDAVSTSYPSADSKSVSVKTSPGSSSTSRMREFMFGYGSCGQPDGKSGSLTLFTRNSDFAIVGVNDAFGQTQSESRAMDLIFNGFLSAIERLKYVRELS